MFVAAQADHVHWHQALKGRCGVRPAQAQLAHVRDIEQAGGLAGVVVLGHQPCRVLHRHAVAGKWHHACAQLGMQGIQGGGQQFGVSGHRHSKGNEQPQHMPWLALAVRFT